MGAKSIRKTQVVIECNNKGQSCSSFASTRMFLQDKSCCHGKQVKQVKVRQKSIKINKNTVIFCLNEKIWHSILHCNQAPGKHSEHCQVSRKLSVQNGRIAVHIAHPPGNDAEERVGTHNSGAYFFSKGTRWISDQHFFRLKTGV